jgi:predicted ATPase
MPVRIYDIAKNLNIEVKQVLTTAKELGIAAAKMPSSSLDKISAEWLEEELIKSLGLQAKRGLLSFGLARFKAFAEAQNIPIKPLTLIFGANSSGKSSVIHGMLLAGESIETGKVDIFKTKLGGDSVDLGGFRQYVHRRRVGDRVEWTAELETRKLSGNAYAVLGSFQVVKMILYFGIPLDDKGNPLGNQSPRLIQYEIEARGRTILRLVKRDDGTMQIVSFDQHAFSPIVLAFLMAQSTSAAGFSETDRATVQKNIDGIWPELRFESIGLLPGRLSGSYQFGRGSSFLALPKAERQTKLAEGVRQFFPGALLEVIKGVNNELRSHLDKMVYLGPLRSYPPRHLAFLEDNDRNWNAGGGFAWDLVRTDSALRDSVNKWLSSADRLKTPYRLEIEKYYAASEIQNSLGQGFNKVAADVIARILGEKKSDDAETTKLLEIRDEIEKERFHLEKELIAIHTESKEMDERLTKQKMMMDSLTARMEQIRIQLQLASQTGETTSEAAKSNRETIESSLKSMSQVYEVSKEMLQNFQEDRQKLAVHEIKTVEKLKELQLKKNEVFSEISANIDSEKLVQWLYDEIQNRPERTPVDELVLRDCRTETRVSHRDVGIGVSQVLPVLVHAYANENKIIAIEQPEIHLHPALQADLGDLFIESALGKRQNTFLLETHSEHLMLRIMRRVRESTEKKADYPKDLPKITPDDISIIFVEPTPKGSVARVLRMDVRGRLIDPWPGGFFEESFNEIF